MRTIPTLNIHLCIELKIKLSAFFYRTLMANIPLTLLLFPLPWFAGMSIYSTYFQCDPLKAGLIDKIDGIVPFFVNDKMTYIPGFLGIFLAALLNGSLWFVFLIS